TRSRIGMPAIGISALGTRSVRGRRRVPSPAARSMASTRSPPRPGERPGPRPAVLLAVGDLHVDLGEALAQVPREPLREVHRAVLPPRAPEVDAQAAEAAREVGLHLVV